MWDGVVQVADEIDAAVIVLGLYERPHRREGAPRGKLLPRGGLPCRRPVLIVPPPARRVTVAR